MIFLFIHSIKFLKQWITWTKYCTLAKAKNMTKNNDFSLKINEMDKNTHIFQIFEPAGEENMENFLI